MGGDGVFFSLLEGDKVEATSLQDRFLFYSSSTVARHFDDKQTRKCRGSAEDGTGQQPGYMGATGAWGTVYF